MTARKAKARAIAEAKQIRGLFTAVRNELERTGREDGILAHKCLVGRQLYPNMELLYRAASAASTEEKRGKSWSTRVVVKRAQTRSETPTMAILWPLLDCET